MDRLNRPLNKAAIKKADDEFYATHPELIDNGKRPPLSLTDPDQADYRNEWIDLYKKHDGEIESKQDDFPERKPDDTCVSCEATCKNNFVTNIAGPSQIVIGEKAEYIVNSYSPSNISDDCKDKVKWRVEVYGKCDTKKPIRVIEDCSTITSVFKIERDKLSIIKVPSIWFCCIAVYAYITTPTIKVRQVSKVKGRIQPILLFERKHDPQKDDMKYGDMSNQEFKQYYMPVCERKTKKHLMIIDAMNSNPLKIFGPKPVWKNEKYITDSCEKNYINFINKSDDEHFALFKSLIEWQSIGALETVALDIIKKVKENKANNEVNYENSTLNERAKVHESSKRFLNNEIVPQLKEKLSSANGDIHNMSLFDSHKMGYPTFNTFMDKVKGMGIVFNGTEGSKVELIDYECVGNDKFRAKLRITVYDHFGLDTNDIKIDNPNERRIHMSIHPFKFLTWAYLQRVKGYKPIVTQIRYEEVVEDRFP
ncbi:MAG: DUF3289 family protein [Algicola sp.]|nr:DUF3289 family protein [Algicola sp.]